MISVAELSRFLEGIAPLGLAESWDNVGLLLGDPAQPVERVMTCLTVSRATADEAIARRCQLIVAHHPLPFHPVRRITTIEPTGQLIWRLSQSSISVFSAHTAWDNAPQGINQSLAELAGLINIRPLKPAANPVAFGELGMGRVGELPTPMAAVDLMQPFASHLGLTDVQLLGQSNRTVSCVAIVCGSGASFLEEAGKAGCDCLITGEANYHQCHEAAHREMALLLLGHHGSERFAMERMAKLLTQAFPKLDIWASRREIDPARNSLTP